jgi:DNA modification methylase
MINKVMFGDCRDSMHKMIDAGVRVQMCVTSPPYWNLRDYGTKGQLGQEDTPQEFVENIVDALDLVWELLADDGTLWLNLGDSYASGGRNRTASQAAAKSGLQGGKASQTVSLRSKSKVAGGLKIKDLAGIPWRVALALQERGWYLRQDIIWQKPNAMPEPVKDRCTKSHEHIFLLSKCKSYYFDHEAIKEPAVSGSNGSQFHTGKTGQHHQGRSSKKRRVSDSKMRNKRDVWSVPTKGYTCAHFAVFPPDLITPCIKAGSKPGDVVLDPFFGSGTTGQVAQSLGRNWIGCELNPEYEPLQKARTSQQGLSLTPPTEEPKT